MLPGQPARNLGSSLEAIFYRIYRRRSVVVVIGVCRCNHKWSGARDRLNAAPWSCHDYRCRPRFPARSNRLCTTRRRRESSSGLSAGSVAHRALAMIVGTPESRPNVYASVSPRSEVDSSLVSNVSRRQRFRENRRKQSLPNAAAPIDTERKASD